MNDRFAISFSEDFLLSCKLSPSDDWDPKLERLHPRGKVGHMLCHMAHSSAEDPSSVSMLDVAENEMLIREFKTNEKLSNTNLLTRVVLSNQKITPCCSPAYNSDLAINLIEASSNSTTPGWYNSETDEIDATLALDSFLDKAKVVRFLRDLLLELTISTSPPVKSAFSIFASKSPYRDESSFLKFIYSKKVSFLRRILAKNAKFSIDMNANIYGDIYGPGYIPFACFCTRNGESPDLSKLLKVWDYFILDLLSTVDYSSYDIANSLKLWPKFGQQLNLKSVDRLISEKSKNGINYLVITPSEKYQEKKNLFRYSVIQEDDICTSTFDNLKKTNSKGKYKQYALKYYFAN